MHFKLFAWWCFLFVTWKGQNEKLKVLSIDVLSNESLQDENLCIETNEELQMNDQSSVAAELNTLSLQEKVAKFIKHGKLDTVEGKF